MKDYEPLVVRGDCVDELANFSADLVIADPPYNIGFQYDDYDDSLPHDEYMQFSRDWILEAYECLNDAGTFWLVISDEYVSELDVLAKQIGFNRRSWIVWYYTFGVNCERNFSRSHTHLLYYTKGKDFVFNYDSMDVRVPSARQLVYNDKRANPNGRLPDNTWILRPSDVAQGFGEDEDTWHIPRVAGTFKERVEGAANQLPELLVSRIINACSLPGQTVLDPFGGTGTTAVVARKLGRQSITIEQSPKWSEIIYQRVQQCKAGDAIAGRAS